MTTTQQIEVNRRNAQRSTGPRTPRGKASSSQNANQHGILSTSPVIPKLESAEAWEQHRASTIHGLAPGTALEAALAERVALILWRLGRVARFERNVTILAQDEEANDGDSLLGPDPSEEAESELDDAREQYASARQTLRALTSLRQLQPAVPVSDPDAQAILEAIAEQIEDFDIATFLAPGILPDGLTYDQVTGWTAEFLDRFVEAIAQATERDAEQLHAAALAEARHHHNHVRATYDRARRQVRVLHGDRLLPNPRRIDRVVRYEAHLMRQLSQTLGHLQQLQKSRPTPDVLPVEDFPNAPLAPLPTSNEDPSSDNQAPPLPLDAGIPRHGEGAPW